MSITTVGDHLIHYEVLGRGKPLIFIHGWLGSWRYWWPAMQGMAAHQYRSFAFDLWGFGDSSKAPEMYSVQSYVEMLDRFIERLGVAPPVTLVGHSLGGTVALQYTLKYPENVDRVFTVALPTTGSTLNERLVNSEPENFLNKVVNNNVAEVGSEIRKTDQAAFNTLAQEIQGNNLTSKLVSFPRPLLMLYGGQDNVIQPPPPDLQQQENNRVYISLDECHHFPMLQKSDIFNRLLLDFILAGDDLSSLAPKEYWKRRIR